MFTVFSGRTREWADLEDMHGTGSLDVEPVLGVLVRSLGDNDERVERWRSLTDPR